MKIFDAHMHIIDKRFPIYENQGFTPDEFTSKDYKDRLLEDKLVSVEGAIVSGSFQKFDQAYLIDALKDLGEGFVGVTQLPHTVTDEEILELNQHGVRAVRFNVKRGGSENLTQLDYFARQIHELANWHIELYIDSKALPDISSTLKTLPKVSIDHLGLSKEGLPHLLALVHKGIRVKATGFGRINFKNPIAPMKEIHEINPNALMFGTDLPSTRANRPYHKDDVLLIKDNFSETDAERILYKNATAWYLE